MSQRNPLEGPGGGGDGSEGDDDTTTDPDDPLRGPGGETADPGDDTAPPPEPDPTPAPTPPSDDTTTAPDDPLRGPGGETANPGGTPTTPTPDPTPPTQEPPTTQPPDAGTGTGRPASESETYVDVPPQYLDEASDLRDRAADQYERYGFEDLQVRYEDGELVAAPTEQAIQREREEVIQEQRADLRERAAEQYGADPEDIVIVREGDQFRAGVDPDAADELFPDASVGGEIEGAGSATGDGGGQTTVRDFDPDAVPAGLGEVAVDVAEQTVDDPVGYVGGGAADFAATVGGDFATQSAEAAGGETAERVADVETVLPQGAVEGFQEAGAFVARGESDEQEGGIAGAFQDAGGLEGLGERAAEGVSEAVTAPFDVGVQAAERAGVPGAERARRNWEFGEEALFEPAAAGVYADAPAAIAEAPGDIGQLAVRGEQAGRVIAEDPGATGDVATTAAGYAGLSGVRTAQQFQEQPARTTATFGALFGGGYAVARTTSAVVSPRVQARLPEPPEGRSAASGFLSNELDPRVTGFGDFRGVGSAVARGTRDRAGDASASLRELLGEERAGAQIPRPLRDDGDDVITGEDIAGDVGRPRQQSPPRRSGTGRREQARRPRAGGDVDDRSITRGRTRRASRSERRRRREAEQPEVDIEEPEFGQWAFEPGARSALFGGALGRVATAQQQDVLQQADQTQRAEAIAVPAIDTAQRTRQDLDQRQRLDTGQDLDQDTDVDTPFDVDPDPDPDPDTPFDTDPDPDPDPDPDAPFPELLDGGVDAEGITTPFGETAEERTAEFVDPFTGEF